MNKDYNNNNSGVLYKNDYKENEKQPDLTGKAEVEGKHYKLSAWTKRNDDGSYKLTSIAFTPKDEVPEPNQPKKDWVKEEVRQKFAQPEEVVLDDIDDEPTDLSSIPF